MANRDGRQEGVLDEGEQSAVEARFGVGSEQVLRDHIISHALAAIATLGTERLVFFGGTALCRTHLLDLRLSEDIDLIALEDRSDTADRIEGAISRRLRRSMGEVAFTPRLRETRHAAPAQMEVGSKRVQIQLLSSEGYPNWPTEVVDVEQRYSDAPPARLRVLTPASFAAAKLSAWHDRAAPRDLYDMWAMAARGMIDAEAARLFSRFGPLTRAAAVSFKQIPSENEWETALRHQCIPAVGPAGAAEVVRDAWSHY